MSSAMRIHALAVRSSLISSRCAVSVSKQAIANFSSAVDNASERESSSWFQKIKSVFTGEQPQQQQQQQEEHAERVSQTASGETFSMIDFADQLKKARQFGSLTAFGRGLPRGGEKQVTSSLERQEQILRKLSGAGQRAGAEQKARVAAECSCTVKDVDDVLGKFEWMKEVHRRCAKLKEEGKPLPKSMEEVEELMKGWWSPSASVNLGKTSDISRNANCPCGSGKKYKR